MDFVTLTVTNSMPGAKPEESDEGLALLPLVKPIRIGAYTMDAKADVIRWRGELLRLSGEERQTLRVLLQHAGQILSCERLASLLHVACDTVDTHIHSLRSTLEASGVTWLPRRAEGCGYILWH